jgi:hypothetical protein
MPIFSFHKSHFSIRSSSMEVIVQIMVGALQTLFSEAERIFYALEYGFFIAEKTFGEAAAGGETREKRDTHFFLKFSDSGCPRFSGFYNCANK